MEVDNNCLSNLDENTEDNQIERSPGSTEQVTESGTFTEVWSEFLCVFCHQDLKHMTNPKLLPCLHTACESCLTSEANSESSPTSTGAGVNSRVIKFPNGVKQIMCPICSQEVNLDDAVDHLFLMEYAQNAETLPEESSCYPCTSCEEGNEGTAFCQDCQEWLCETCVSAHHRVRVTKDHVVRPKDEMEGENAAMHNQKYLLCPVHPNERLKVYCETCDKLTCRDCQLSDHKAHKYQFLRNACDEEKDNITELLGKIKEKQGHMEEASNSLNKRHDEIVERETQISQEIQLFGVKFITDINKRAKALLQDLNKVCTDKKNLINVKSQELKSVAERLKHCQKFAEAAMALGSETALVYSKKPIMNQLRRILRHKCDVPNPHHVVDIQFSYETNFLSQYISSLGQILVDQLPLPGSANASAMLPMPQNISQSPVPSAPVARQVPQMQMNQRATIPPVQQINQQQQQIGPYGQPQVTSSTDLVRNNNPQMRQMMNNQMNFGRGRGPVPNQQGNFQMQPNANYSPRQLLHQQQSPQVQMRQRPQQQQIQQQQQQQPPPQQQQQIQQPPPYANNQLPVPLRTNKNISITTLPSPSGPSPSKQRAIAPRSNMTMNNQGSNMQRMNNNQVNQARQSQQPQLIVLDDNQKTPNMSNTTRLTHFPSNLAATLAANPSLQIQPANQNFQNSLPIQTPHISVIQFTQPPTSSTLTQSSPTLLHQLMQPHLNMPQANYITTQAHTTQSVTPVTTQNFSNMNTSCMLTSSPNPQHSGYPYILPKTNSSPMPSNSPNITATNTSCMSNISPNPQLSGYPYILPKPNTSPLPSSSPNITVTVSNEAGAQNNNPTGSDNFSDILSSSCLKDLLSDAASIPAGKTGSGCSSPDSLPSLDCLLNLVPSLQDITVTAITDDNQTPSLEINSDNTRDSNKNSDSNSSELSNVFQKSCRTSEDKCTVCKEGKDLIYCSSCPKVYHATCHVPILLSSKSVPSKWICMMCRDVLTYPIPDEDSKKKLIDLQGRELLICERILLEIFIHPKSLYFHSKVSRKVPNYYKVIKRPMDLSTIRMKLSPTHFEHYADVEEFCDDMRLIFENCFTFNSVGSDVYNAGKEIQEFFETILSQYFPELSENA